MVNVTPKKNKPNWNLQTPKTVKRKREEEIIHHELELTPKSPKLDKKLSVNKPLSNITSKILFHEKEIDKHTPNNKLNKKQSMSKFYVAQKKPPDKP